MVTLDTLFRELNDRGGRYVLVGGLAVVLHGHLRATSDIDLVIDLAADQVVRTLAALHGAGFQPYLPVPPTDFADPVKRAVWAREKGMMVFSLRPPQGVPMVDLFLEYPRPFEELWARSVTMHLRGVPVRLVSVEDLLALKREAGRPAGRALSDTRGKLPPDREALLRTTLALTVDQRVEWLEAMMLIAINSGALPKRSPDQLTRARQER